MSQKPNPTSIGLFIVIGAALGVTGLLLFGSTKMFTKTTEVIVYFDESLNGLNEGAPVKYRGVTIGSVKRVMVHFNQATNDYAMPVILELRADLIRDRWREPAEPFSEKAVKGRVYGGLRATLQAESLVTGVLYVNISPNPKASEAHFHQLKKIYPEVPSEPTQIQQIFDNLASLDLKGISTNLNAAITRLDLVLRDLQMAEISAGLTNTLASLNQLISSPDIGNSLASLRMTLDEYRALGERLNGRIDPLADSITNMLAEANRTLTQLQGASDNLRGMLRPDAPLQHNLDQLLRQFAGTAESVSALAEFLRQHPNALITGREEPKKP
jgi:paraquat-inducible protein B